MDSVIFIGDRLNATPYRNAGIPSYVPSSSHLTERVLAERHRCRILAMTERAFEALPDELARELRESELPRLAIVPELKSGFDELNVRETLDLSLAREARAQAPNSPPSLA